MSYGKPEYDPVTDAHRCEECGRWFRALARHITRKHRVTTREYKLKWGINVTEPLLGETVRAKLREAVYKQGTFKNLESGLDTRFRSGKDSRHRYHRSEQTKRHLRVLRKLSKRKWR